MVTFVEFVIRAFKSERIDHKGNIVAILLNVMLVNDFIYKLYYVKLIIK